MPIPVLYLYLCRYLCLHLYPHLYLHPYLGPCLSIYLSIYLYIYLSLYLSTYVCTHQVHVEREREGSISMSTWRNLCIYMSIPISESISVPTPHALRRHAQQGSKRTARRQVRIFSWTWATALTQPST